MQNKTALALLRTAITLLGLISFSAAKAEEEPARNFIEHWIEQQKALENTSVAFTQTRKLTGLKAPPAQPGHLWMKANGDFRMEFGKPAETIVIGGKGRMIVLDVRRQQAHLAEQTDETSNSKSAQWRQRLGIMRFPFARSYDEMRQDFDVRRLIFRGDIAELDLSPRSPEMRRSVDRLRFMIERASGFVQRLEIVFRNGGSIINEFAQPVRDHDLPDSLFMVDLSGYKIESE